MDTGFAFSNDSFDAWLGGFADAAVQTFLQPGALEWILAIVVGIWVLAFIVASMSESPNDSASGADGAGRSGLAVLIGDACAWVCPWQPSPRAKRHIRAHRRPLAVG